MISTVAAMKSRRDRKAAVIWSDSELIQACRGGDPDAWNELVDRYGRLVYWITRRCGLSEDQHKKRDFDIRIIRPAPSTSSTRSVLTLSDVAGAHVRFLMGVAS